MTQKPTAKFWAPEKLVELSILNLESAKKDLEKNWMSQLFALGASLAAILGLGALISQRVFGEPGYENILYLLLPMANFYLFLRFGNLLSTFSEARFAAEQLVTNYYENARSLGFPVDTAPDKSAFYKTNSYFEYYHTRDADQLMFMYLLLVPIILTLNNVTSLFMLLTFFGRNIWGYSVAALSLAGMIALYIGYYLYNRDKSFAFVNRNFNFIKFAYTLIFLIGLGLWAYVIEFGVPFSLKAQARSAAEESDWNAEDFLDGL